MNFEKNKLALDRMMDQMEKATHKQLIEWKDVRETLYQEAQKLLEENEKVSTTAKTDEANQEEGMLKEMNVNTPEPLMLGFDVHPPLPPIAAFSEMYAEFLAAVYKRWQHAEAPGGGPLLRIIPQSRGGGLELMICDRPHLPSNAKDFLRFASRDSLAGKWICKILMMASLWFGEARFHSWISLWNDDGGTENQSTTTRYAVDQVNAARKVMEEEGAAKVAKRIVPASQSQGNNSYTVTPIPGKGMGVIAATKISNSDAILVDKPLFKIAERLNSVLHGELIVFRAINKLDKDKQREYLSLANSYDKPTSPFFGVARTNFVPLGPGSAEGGIFPVVSRFNHSCLPNASFNWDSTRREMTVHAIRDIEEGEEITTNYFRGVADGLAERQKATQGMRFDCGCVLCSLPLGQRLDEGGINRRGKLADVLASQEKLTQDPMQTLNWIHTEVGRFEARGQVDIRLAELFEAALNIVIANGDEARAVFFANRVRSVRIAVSPEDNQELDKFGLLMLDPTIHPLYQFGGSTKWKQQATAYPQGVTAEEFDAWLWRDCEKAEAVESDSTQTPALGVPSL